ncbi:MAG TPA: RyR domain-containing protein [Ferruginibacter sp.]|nr:RyR domain-containing protein [Ferruginibacter sp.]
MVQLPDMEQVSPEVHKAWMTSKKDNGISSRRSEDGEELMVPYELLSEKAREPDRNTVKAVYAAIKKLQLKT